MLRVVQSCTTASNENDGFDYVIDDAQNDVVEMFTVCNGGDAVDETIFNKWKCNKRLPQWAESVEQWSINASEEAKEFAWRRLWLSSAGK